MRRFRIVNKSLWAGLLVIFCLSTAYSQKVNPDFHKLWQQEAILSWDDFKGTPDSTLVLGKGHSDAGIHTIIIVDYCCTDDGGDDLCLHTAIHTGKSWVATRSDKLLAHEQLHFDIAELITRKVRQAIQEQGETTAKRKYQIYLKSVRKYGRLQINYDRETDHGTDELRQEEWRQRVQRELEELSAFSTNPSGCH